MSKKRPSKLIALCIIAATASMSVFNSNFVKADSVMGDVYVSTNRSFNNDGTLNSPTTFEAALTKVAPGGAIYVMGGTYNYNNQITIQRGNDGQVDKFKNIQPYNNGKVISSSETCGKPSKVSNDRGLQVNGAYWHIRGIEVKGAVAPVTIKDCVAYNNGATSNGTSTAYSDGNGFKLGGDKIAVSHVVKNWVSFNNKKHGFTFNSNAGSISLTNCTGYNNGSSKRSNFAFNNGTAILTSCLSYKASANDKISADATVKSNVF